MPREEAAALVRDAEPGSCTMGSDVTRGVTGFLARLSLLPSYSPVFRGGVRGSKSDLLELKRWTFISECAVFTTEYIYLMYRIT